MKKSVRVILEILILIIAAVVYFFIEVWPDFKNSLGSSDHLIDASKYKNMFEFNIDNNIGFALVINEDKEVYHIFFYNDNASCLYNKNIENNKIDKALTSIVEILIDNNYLKSTSNIVLTNYGSFYNKDFNDKLTKALSKYSVKASINYLSSTLDKKAMQLDVYTSSGDATNLRNIDFYSREFIRDVDSEKIVITEVNAQKYTNQVYKKIEKYIYDNKIKSIDKNNTNYPINLIPVDDNDTYYPSSKSWYYVDNGKIYAYIEVGNNYGYCYKGSIDDVSKGECK